MPEIQSVNAEKIGQLDPLQLHGRQQKSHSQHLEKGELYPAASRHVRVGLNRHQEGTVLRLRQHGPRREGSGTGHLIFEVWNCLELHRSAERKRLRTRLRCPGYF